MLKQLELCVYYYFTLIFMTFELPKLPYANDALEPHISEETLGYHYGKHHARYVANLNAALPGTTHEGKSLEDIIKSSQ